MPTSVPEVAKLAPPRRVAMEVREQQEEVQGDVPRNVRTSVQVSNSHLQNGVHHIQNGLQNGAPDRRYQRKGIIKRALSWVDAKIYVYNVTFGLYMLDWWERVLFNVLALLLVWFLCYTISDFLIDSFKDPESAFQGWKPSFFTRESVDGDL